MYDDDDEIEDEEEGDEEEEEDEDDLLARIEQAYRSDRAKIRVMDDVHELRAQRAEYEQLLASGRLHQAGRLRARDLLELIDDRVTDVKAKRLASRHS